MLVIVSVLGGATIMTLLFTALELYMSLNVAEEMIEELNLDLNRVEAKLAQYDKEHTAKQLQELKEVQAYTEEVLHKRRNRQ